MVSFTKKPLLNNDIPKEVERFITDELTNYIVIKDGHIIRESVLDKYEDIEIKTLEYAHERLVYKQFKNITGYL